MPRLVKQFTIGFLAIASASGPVHAQTPAAPPSPTYATGPDGHPLMPGMASLVVPLLPQVVSIATVSYALKSPPSSPPSSQSTGSPAAYDSKQIMGSGFIVDADGLIVTNQHVIDDGAKITVTLSDNTRLKATVVAENKVIDVALLKVSAGRPLTPVKFGDSEALRQGDRVLVIGNPLGLGESVSSGIVSALDRDIHTSPYDAYIQTDAALNHGNSGGAMFDTAGEVVGMNTALISAVGETGSVGLGFAIPGNDVVFIIDEMRKFGRVRPGWLGAVVQQVTGDLADGLGLKEAGGSVVLSVAPDSPAARAGLQFGDVITSFDGKRIAETRTLNRAVAVTKLNSTVPVQVWRNRVSLTIPVTVVENPDSVAEASGGPMIMPPHVARADMGMQVAQITDALRRQFGLDETDTGLIVTDVIPFSVAAERDVTAGSLIERVDQNSIHSLDDWHQTMEDAWRGSRDHMLVLLKEKSGERLVALPTSIKPE